MSAATPERLHGLDALRAIALLLGVFLHASLSFQPGAQYWWIVTDSDASSALGLAFYLIHMFRMIVFFLIAGFFGRMLLERLGARAFVQDRWRRIAVPLLAGWPILFPAIVMVIIWAALLANNGQLPATPSKGPAFTPDDFPLTHLWFLYSLLLCYALMLALRGLIARIDRGARLDRLMDAGMRVLLRPWAPLLLALPLCIGLLLQPKWMMWFGIPTPDHSLYPNLAAVLGYGGAFVFGWLLQRQTALLHLLESRWLGHLLLASIASGTGLAIVGITPVLTAEPQGPIKLAYAVCYSIAAWSWALALTGLSLRFLSGYSALRRYLADASYWIYLVHLPLVMALQVALARLEWPWWLKFPLLLAIAFALMLGSYHCGVRHSFIGERLNGRRLPKPQPARLPLAGRAADGQA